MKRARFTLITRVLAAAGAVVILLMGFALPAQADDSSVETYIVSTDGGTTLAGALDRVAGQNEEILPEVGLATADLTPAQASVLDAQPGVEVYADAPVALADVQDNPGWALDRLDQKQASVGSANPNHQYWYPPSAGAGVRIYVVDTGVTTALAEFGGRALRGYDATTGLAGDGTDCYGHGTEVSSVAAGKTAGVAKAATIVSVRVLSCSGSGNQSGVIAGLNWIMANNPVGTPAVINLSLAGLDASATTVYSPMDKAVKSAVDAGFFVAVAAGNSSPGTGIYAADACQMSPARVPEAFTVGAVDGWATGIPGKEGRATFSDAGSCVDAWAPGVNVPTITKTGAAATPSGTSFSSPLAAGLAALYLAENSTSTPLAVDARLKATALSGALINTPALPLDATVKFSSSSNIYASASTSPNLLLQSPIAVPDTAVAGLTVGAPTRTTAALAWTAPPTLTVRLVVTQGATVTAVTAPAGSGYTLTGLIPGLAYSVTADAVNQGLIGFGSATIRFTTSTAVTAPGLPRSLTASSKGLLSWAAPADNGGSAVTGYRVQISTDSGESWGSPITTAGLGLQLPDLADRTSFQARVAAVNAPGGQGAFSAVASFITASQQPGAPLGLTVTGNTAAAVRLAWAAPADTGAGPVLDYVISWSMSPGTSWTTETHPASAVTGFSSTYPALRTGQNLNYRVQAKTAYGLGPAATVSFTVPPPQADAPTGLAASGIAEGGATLKWVAPANIGAAPISDYTVAYSLDGGVTYTSYSHAASSATSITLAGLTPSRAYTVRVSAVNRYSTGEGATVSFNTLVGTPSAPGAISLASNLVLGASLVWTAPSSVGAAPISDYLLSYSLDGGATYTAYAHAKSPAAKLTVLYPAAQSLTAYLWKIQGVNSFGAGPGTSVAYTTPSTIASAPRGLSATDAAATTPPTPGRTVLRWATPASAGATAITDYRVTRSTDGGVSWQPMSHPVSIATTLTVTTPTASPTALYRVQAVNSYGPGLISQIQK
jgi:subtilisin family serine protease